MNTRPAGCTTPTPNGGGEAVALDYVPGRLDQEAPPRVWLQIDTSASNDERDEAWPGADHVTWQDESIGGLEIQYVRADLATTPPTPSAPDKTFAEWLASEMPAGTVIGDPAWWADRIARQYAKRCTPPSAPALYRCVECDDHYRVGTPCDCKSQPPSAPAEYMRHPSGDGTIVRKDDPSRRLSVDEILAEMRGPSAPVVDDAERGAFYVCPTCKGPGVVTRETYDALSGVSAPVEMLLFCPKCSTQHIDAPDERTPGWDNPPHRSHLCHACGHIWRPADVATTGVAALTTKGERDGSPVPSAPVGVEERVRGIIALLRKAEPDNGEKYTEHDAGYDQASREIADMLDRALTPPAAAPRAETCGFCGKEGKHAAGESCPELDGAGAPWKLIPAASEDGLPELPAGFQWDEGRDITGEPWLSIKASDGTTAWSGDPHGDEANHMFDLIRRLAATGQGVEAIKTLATGSNSVEVYGPGNHGGSADWLVAVRDNNTDSANEYEAETLEAALSAAGATTTKGGNA